jgi:hypothetical protein
MIFGGTALSQAGQYHTDITLREVHTHIPPQLLIIYDVTNGPLLGTWHTFHSVLSDEKNLSK